MALVLTALTLTQLFARQAQLAADHERILAARNACAPLSFDWDLQNAALTGTMQDIADAGAEILARIQDMAAETEPAHVPMVCTACRKPVFNFSEACRWIHETHDDFMACPVDGETTVKAMVAAGNERVSRG